MRQAGQTVAAAVVLNMAAVCMAGAATPAFVPPSAEARGYRLRGYQWDAVLGRRWAVFEDAAHPERPPIAELDPVGGADSNDAPVANNGREILPLVRPASAVVKVAELIVRSGDAVTLWKDEDNLRMQLAAVAEGNASLGGQVQLRVVGAGAFGGTGWRATGVVRGPGSVEME